MKRMSLVSIVVSLLSLILLGRRLFTSDDQIKAAPDERNAKHERHHRSEQLRLESGNPVLPETQPFVNAPKSTDGQTAGQQKKAVTDTRRARWPRTWLPVVFSGLTFIVIVTQTYIYRKQWEAMLIQVNEVKSTREIENRAYVLVKNIRLQRPADRYGDIEIGMDFENLGRTPAFSTYVMVSRQSIWWGVAEDPKTTDFYLRDEDLGGGMTSIMGGYNILPNTSMGMSVRSNWTRNDLPGTDFFVWGSISYSDIFNQGHKTRFCYRNGPNNPKEPRTPDALVPCRYHNKFE